MHGYIDLWIEQKTHTKRIERLIEWLLTVDALVLLTIEQRIGG